MTEPSASLLTALRRLDDENLRKAYGEATSLVRQELARLNEFSRITGAAVISEDGRPAGSALPPEFYQAMAVCLAGLDRLAAMRARSSKAKDELFADASDDDLNRNLARAMASLLEEMPVEDIEDVLRRRRNLDAAEAGAPRWGRRVADEEPPVLELAAPMEDA